MNKLLIILLSLISLLGLAILLSVTVFKEDLAEWVIEQNKIEYEQIRPYYVSEIPVEPDCFAEDFESIHNLVMEKCSLYEQKGINMDSLYTSLATRIGNEVKTKADYGLLVCEYFSALNIGHANALLDVYWAMYFPTSVEERLFIDSPNEYVSKYGFCDKDEIVAINGTPIQQYVNGRKKYTHASTEAARIHLTNRWALRSHTDSLLICDILRNGKPLTLELPLTTLPSPENGEKKVAKGKILNENVGYISIDSMSDNVVDEFKLAYQEVSHLPYLIVDIRKNGGGQSDKGKAIAEYLVINEQEHCLGGEIIPQASAYKGKLYLLTSNFTFSAAESFALDMKESGNATLVGEATAGDTGNAPKFFMSKHGIYFRIPTREPKVSPKGFRMEGLGIEPDYEIKQTVEDFFYNKDTVLEYVLNELI